MRDIKKVLIVILLLSTLIYCDSQVFLLPHIEVERPLSQQEKSLVATDNAFGIRLFQEINQTQADTNIFISPLSVSMALGMTYNGSAGTTEEAMRTTLGFGDMSKEEMNASYRSLIDLLQALDSSVIFEIANSIWSRAGFSVKQGFIDINRQFFDAEVQELNFSLPSAPGTINDWIADKTHGKIDNVITSIPPETMMYVINAIYFLGFWRTQFDPNLTADESFASPVGSVPCRMMHLESRLRYYETDTFQAVDLPYGKDKYSMTAVLPKSGFAVDSLISYLTPEDLITLNTLFVEQDVILSFPKFKLEYEIELKDVLIALGMGVAFDPSYADFTQINSRGDLYISGVLHKTFVEVDEEGTEAAAVTVVELGRTSIGGKRFSADHPFLFIIRDNHSGTILFIGKIVEPKI